KNTTPPTGSNLQPSSPQTHTIQETIQKPQSAQLPSQRPGFYNTQSTQARGSLKQQIHALQKYVRMLHNKAHALKRQKRHFLKRAEQLEQEERRQRRKRAK
ncbi:MAG: hypothetical protein AAGJ35_12295, partial [Myxococcota bacterium]